MVRFKDFIRCGRGSTAVEFSMILGPMLLLIFGICEFSRMLWTEECLQEAAISGARCVGMLQSNCTANNVYNSTNATGFIQTESLKWGVTLPTANVVISTTATCGGVSGFSQVSLTYNFQSIIPQMLTLLTNGNTLTATACFPTA